MGSEDVCNTPSPLGVSVTAPVRINTGLVVLTASVAVKVEGFSFVYVAAESGMISGVSLPDTQAAN